MESRYSDASARKQRRLKDQFNFLPPWWRIGIYGVVLVIFVGALWGLWQVNEAFSVEVPAQGGTLTEGLIGTPRFVNPVLATTNTDQTLTELLYAGLLKHAQTDGYSPELAREYSVSNDGKTYTVELKKGLTWHDGQAITAEDVIFTVQKIRNESLRSPKGADWEEVTLEKRGSHTLVFRLEESYPSFLENLTTGIIPKHIWEGKTPRDFLFARQNTRAIGSGPYQLERIRRSEEGPPEAYVLKPFANYALGSPRIETLEFIFFDNQQELASALDTGAIEAAAAISPKSASKIKNTDTVIRTTPLLRTFSVFFNQDENQILAEREVRKAFALAAPKKRIVKDVLHGYGQVAQAPLPSIATSSPQASQQEQLSKARTLLEGAGWSRQEGFYQRSTDGATTTLSLELSTARVPELEESARLLTEAWETLGASTTLTLQTSEMLSQQTIRPRNFQALLFGQVTGQNPDLYPFWHSSQRTDPGLNIAGFTDIEADDLLEEARTATSSEVRRENYRQLGTILSEQQPTIFLYRPQFLYATPSELRGLELAPMTRASQRYLNISNWYLETKKLWKPFSSRSEET